MDPVSFLLGFTRALVPPMAPPAPQRGIPGHAATDLGLDHERIRAIYADSRVMATPTKKEAAAPPQPFGEPPNDAAAAAAAAGAEASAEAKAEANQSAQRVQQLREAERVHATSRVDALDQIATTDPLMVATMKAIYADRLTLSAPSRAVHLDAWFAADAPLPWAP